CKNLYGLLAIMCQQDVISLCPQNGLRHLANTVVVVGQQDCFSPSAHGQIIENEREQPPGRRGFVDRKKDPKCASAANFALDENESVVLFDDTIEGGHPQSGTFPCYPGGEERLENPFSNRGIHSNPRVAYSEFRKAAGLDSICTAGVLFGENSVVRFDGDPPPFGHCVARIDTQIHEYLLDLRGIGPDSRQIIRQICFDVDVLADYLAKQV